MLVAVLIYLNGFCLVICTNLEGRGVTGDLHRGGLFSFNKR